MTVRARLNRRRYREVVATLKEIISDKKAPQQRRLRAVEMLLEVYSKHDRMEERRAAQKRASDAPETPGQPDASTDAEETGDESVDAFLARVTGGSPEDDEDE
jgi:hypothetical protein